MIENCGNCYFSRDAADGRLNAVKQGDLECHRRPPVFNAILHSENPEEAIWGYWPEVLERHWCGEWRDSANNQEP